VPARGRCSHRVQVNRYIEPTVTLDTLFRRWRRATELADLDAYTRRILLNTWLDERRRPWRRGFTRDRLPDGRLAVAA
jgi:DNA-directed RNA polymerase specialized sigma24 family protein